MADLATFLDVEDRLLRPLTDSETTAAVVLLEQASALVRLRLPSIDERVALDDSLQVVTRGVVAEAVARVLRNPDGKVQESIDDYSYRRSDGVAEGALYLRDEEWAQLRLPRTVRAGTATLRAWTWP